MVEPRRILIVRPSALGDVCRTVPVLATLRRAHPDATIDWLVQEDYAPAIRAHPALDEAVTFPRSRFSRGWRDPVVAWEVLRWLGRLRRRRYDLVFDLQGLGRSGLMTWSTGAPRRVGHRGARELGWLGYNVRHRAARSRHTVERMMSLLVAEGLEPVWDMTLHVAEADRAWWRERRARDELAGPYVVLAPTSRWRSKRWPPESWARLVEPLRERGLGPAVIVGSPSERDQVEPVVARRLEGVVDLVGAATLGQTMAVIAAASLVVAHDSAPLHMAVGFARPCVGLYGPTDPDEVGPFGRPDAVVRRAEPDGGARARSYRRRGGADLMGLIRPEDVLERIDRVLGLRRPEAVVGSVAVPAGAARRRKAAS